MAAGDLGEVFVEAHVDNKHVAPELERGVKEAAEKVEKDDDFGGFVKSANKAGTRAGKEFGDGFFRDADGRLRDASGRFAKDFDKVGDEASNAFSKKFEEKTNSRIRRLGKLLAPAWARTIAVWVAILTPAAANLAAVVAPAVGLIAAIVPAAIGAAASLVVLKLAFKGVGAAIKDAGTDKFADDMKKLAPATQGFVKQIIALKKPLDEFRKNIGGAFFSGLGDAVTDLYNRLKPLQKIFIAISGTMGVVANHLASIVGQRTNVQHLGAILATWRDILKPLGDAFGHIYTSLLTIGAQATPLLSKAIGGFDRLTKSLDDFLTKAASDGSLQRFFQTAIEAGKQLWAIVKAAYDILAALIGAAAAAGGGGGLVNLLTIIGDTFTQLKDSGALTSLFETFNTIFSTAGTLLEILLPPLGQLILALSGSLKDALIKATPGLTALALALADVVTQLTPAIVATLDLAINTILLPFLNFIADNPGVAKLLAQTAVAIGLVTAATKLWAAAQAILDAALDANPIGLFILAIAALGIALYSIYVNTKKIIEAILHPAQRSPFFQAIIDQVTNLKDILVTFFTKTIPDAFNSVKSFFTDTIPNTFMTMVNAVVGFFTALPGRLLTALQAVPGLILTFFQNVFNAALTAVGVGIGLLYKLFISLPPLLIRAMADLIPKIGQFFVNVWNTAIDKTTQLVTSLLIFLAKLPGRVVNAMITLGTVVANLFRSAWNKATDVVTQGITNVVRIIAGLPGKITALGTKLYNAGVTIIKQLINGLAHPGSTINSVGDKVISAVKGALNALIRQINHGIDKVNSAIPFGSPVPHIPLLAKGGIIDRPTLAVIGEKGTEVVLPTNDPKRAQQLLEESGLAAHLSSPAPDVYVLVQIGDETIEAKVTRKINQNNAQQAFALTAGTRAA